MSEEIELKLRIKPEDKSKLFVHPLLSQVVSHEHHIWSGYYDTPDFQLQERGAALRMRKIDGIYWQTLKSNEKVKDGLFHRQEWEKELSEAVFNFDLFPRSQQEMLQALKENLINLFVTDFKRTVWELELNNEQKIEVALDEGEIVCGEWKEPIFELELEIKKGDKPGLIKLTEQLRQTIPLRPFDQSKAQRGYRLFQLAACHEK